MRRPLIIAAVLGVTAAAGACSLDWTFVEPVEGQEGGADGAVDGAGADAGIADGGDASSCDGCADAGTFKCGPVTECVFPGGVCVFSAGLRAFACDAVRGCVACDCVDGGGVCSRQHGTRFASCDADGGGGFVSCE